MDTCICRACNEVKIRIDTGKKSKTGSRYYVDERGSWWKGKICPSCTSKRRKVQKPTEKIPCAYCGKPFLPSRSDEKYCKISCRVSASRKKNKPVQRNCAHCNESFITTRQKFYCKESHTPSSIRSRKRAKRVRKARFKQKISKYYKNEINRIYDNKGTFEVDHIIPLNHYLVCGLHVPRNLQYLDPEENSKKSK